MGRRATRRAHREAAGPDATAQRRHRGACPPFRPGQSVRGLGKWNSTAAKRYETERWPIDRGLGAAPSRSGAQGELLYTILMNSGARGAPGEETIRKVLSAAGRVKLSQCAYPESAAKRIQFNQNGEHGPGVIESESAPLNAHSPSVESTIATLRATPVFQAAAAKAHAEGVAHRESLLARRRQIEKEAEAEWPKDVRAEEAAAAEVRAAERALKDANQKLAAASAARGNGALTRRIAVERIDAELAAGDWPEISAFFDMCEAEIERTKGAYTREERPSGTRARAGVSRHPSPTAARSQGGSRRFTPACARRRN